jgi:hypothetical protein
MQPLIFLQKCNKPHRYSYNRYKTLNRYKLNQLAKSVQTQSINPSRGSKARRGSSFLLLNSTKRVIKQLEVREAQTRNVAFHQCTEIRLQVMEIPPVQAQLLQFVLAGA